MPNYTTFFFGCASFSQIADYLANGAILIITCHYFHFNTLLNFYKQGVVLQNIHQNFLVEHSVNQHFLPFLIRRKLNSLIFLRKNIYPIVVEIKFGTDGSYSGFFSMGDNAENIVVKQF